VTDTGFIGVDDMLEDSFDNEAIMPIASIRILKCIDSDGDEQIRIRFAGNESPPNLLGLLEFVKVMVNDQIHRSYGGGDDAP